LYHNVLLLTVFYLFPPVFYNSYHSLEIVKKKLAKLNEPSVQLVRRDLPSLLSWSEEIYPIYCHGQKRFTLFIVMVRRDLPYLLSWSEEKNDACN
jgi:hypothetical protein